MSEFIADALVRVRPDTTKFRTDLEKQLLTATRGITVPVSIVAAGGGLAGLAAATGGLAAAQKIASGAALDLTTDEQILNSVYGKQAVILEGLNAATLQQAGAQDLLDASAKRTASRFAQFRSGVVASLASLTGLRGAVLAASGPFLVAAVAAGAFLKSLQAFSAFETELNVFAVTAGATAQQMEAVSELAKQLGNDLTLPAVSASDAASAMTELARAGLTVQEAMDGARGVLQLATAAGISTGEAAQFAANELNAFGLAGDQAVRVADVLANSANAAQGSISDFGLAFKQSAAVANLVGLSLEDTAAQLTILARAGLQGSDAGTSLRVALLRLINPTKDAAAVIHRLGIDLRDAQGNIRPDVFVQFGEATRTYTKAARDAAFATVFGTDAIRTVAIAAEGGRDALVDATIAIGEQGTAAELAAAQTGGFGGQLEGLKNSAATAAVSLGEVSTVIAGPLVLALNIVAGSINSVIEPLADLVRLSKEKLGLTFDPASASAADLLARIDELKAAYGDLLKVAGPPQELFQATTEDAIRALENQRSTLKALGLDTSAVTAVIEGLQKELLGVAASSEVTTTGLQKTQQVIQDIIDAGKGTPGLEALNARLKDLIFSAERATLKIGDLPDGITKVGLAAQGATPGVNALADAMSRLTQQSTMLSDQLQKAQAEGASPQTQISILQQDIAVQNQKIAEAEKGGRQAGDITTIRKARDKIISDNAEIKSLQEGIVSDQKAAAATAKDAATQAQKARDDQFKALADLFGGRQQNIEDAIERAGIRGNVAKEQRLNEALIDSLLKELRVLRDRLKTLKVTAAVRKALFDAINKALEDARQDRIRFQQEQAEQLQENLFKNLDFRVSLAQAQDNTVAELRARRARLAAITAELIKVKNSVGKNTDRWRELRLAQAEEIAEIKRLEKETQDKNKANQSLFFTFLQTQSGFAANLLGNLIPGFATAGLVGNTPTAGQPAFDTGRRPDQGVQTAADIGVAKDRGVRPVQVDRTNHILMQILAALTGKRVPPEIVHNRSVASGGMDTLQ